MIAIIDYDAGNLKSVEKAFEYIGKKVIVTKSEKEILNADKVVLPGVGAFGDAMRKLEKFKLADVIKKVVNNNTPLLGICLGLQLLFEKSEESKGVKGLSVLKGEILKIPNTDGIKIPHIGWNSLNIKDTTRLFNNIPQEAYVYFVHSFYLKADNRDDVAAVCEYGTHIDAAVEHNNIFACQFHPEKSGDTGLYILKNFAEI